ncbi:hypothetical protein HMPREF2087_01843 [Helicobacter canis NCTC 12740]|uniref:Uncharacterized protein n=1 Tax=Helicobacter canis NCTC 12740 TaxID=1357399 RepID=V8CG96_9HELI|nr:hypothetical protein HMPREF2087_01843 [Helicobacter canis NCTC 12740]
MVVDVKSNRSSAHRLNIDEIRGGGVNKYTYCIGVYICCLCFLCVIPFSALAAFLLSCIFFFFGHRFLDSFARYLSGLCLVLSACVVYGSRAYFLVDSDDFIRYYAGYVHLLEQDSVFAWWQWAFRLFGFELGLPAYYGILTIFFW